MTDYHRKSPNFVVLREVDCFRGKCKCFWEKVKGNLDVGSGCEAYIYDGDWFPLKMQWKRMESFRRWDCAKKIFKLRGSVSSHYTKTQFFAVADNVCCLALLENWFLFRSSLYFKDDTQIKFHPKDSIKIEKFKESKVKH